MGEFERSGWASRVGLWLDRGFFLVVALGGAMLIVLLRVSESAGDSSSSVAMVMAIALMAMYFVCVVKMERFRLRYDQAGDNMYYLGFIYTLASLSVALYQFQAGIKASHYIASNFGVALASTIVGVATRVLLHQMREDPVDIERESRAQLSHAAAALRAELDQTVRDFNSYRRSTQQSVEEGLRELGDAALGVLKEAAAEYKSATEDAVSGIKGAYASLKIESRAMNQSATRLTESLEKLTQRIDRIDAPQDLVVRVLEPLTTKIADVVSDLKGASEAQQAQGDRLIETISGLDRAVGRLGHSSDSAASALGTLSREGVGDYRRQIDALSVSLTNIVNLTEVVGETQRQLVHRFEASFRAQGEQMASDIDRSTKLNQELSEMHRLVLSQIKDGAAALTAQLEQQHDALARSLATQTLQALDGAKQHREELERELAVARESTLSLTGQLASLANVMADEFKRSAEVN